jgi:hypothetical protein
MTAAPERTAPAAATSPMAAPFLPGLGGLIMYAAGIYSLQSDWVATNSYTSWTIPGLRWQVGGIFVIAVGAALVGVLGFIYMRVTAPAPASPARRPRPARPASRQALGRRHARPARRVLRLQQIVTI